MVSAESSGAPMTTTSSSISNLTSTSGVLASNKASSEWIKKNWERMASMEAKAPAIAPNATQGNHCFVGPTLSKHEGDDYITMVGNKIYPTAPPSLQKSAVIIGAGLSGQALYSSPCI